MHQLADALLGSVILADKASAFGSGWLIALVLGAPTSVLGYAAYRAQRGRDRLTDDLRQENEEKERDAQRRAEEAQREAQRKAEEADRRATDAVRAAAENEHLRIIQAAQQQAMESLQQQLAARDEAIVARDIEVTRLHALETEWHDERLRMRASMRSTEDALARCRRRLADLGHSHTDEGSA